MIAFPQHVAPSRTRFRHASTSPLSTLAALFVAALVALTGATAAHAAGGGVSVSTATSTTTKKAKGAASDDDPAVKPKSVSKAQLKRAQTLLSIAATGTHDASTRKAVKRFQRLRGLGGTGVVDLATYLQIKDAFALLETGGIGVADADTVDGGGISTGDTAAPPFVLPPNVAPITPTERDLLDKIAQCESQGDPTIVSSNGLYRGKYQFDRTTWKTVGGTGDPAAATEEEQDQRAAILLRQRGTAPWPVCGL